MLNGYASTSRSPVTIDPEAGRLSPEINWIDAFRPTPVEMSFLEKMMNARIPTMADLVEIETSSRLAIEDQSVIMSLPAFVKDEEGYPRTTPIGFVVTTDKLATIRFEPLPPFDALAKQICSKGELSQGGLGATVTLLEVMVDNIADLLERIGEQLDQLSRSIFSDRAITARSRPRRANRILIGILRDIGRSGDLISRTNETLLGLSRMAPFLLGKGSIEVTPEVKTRLETILTDAKSLHEFQEHLANKTQFLLDTLLGLTNIEQNNVFRVLTVVSVIGITPTFFASMYGMNFKSMPEYDWPHGYAFGLTLIVLGAVIPAVWFKVKGWW